MSQRLREKYHIILCLDSLHHATNIPDVLRTIRVALNPGGIYVCCEDPCTDTLEKNIGAGGAMPYASSVFVCVLPVLSEGSETLGIAALTISKWANSLSKRVLASSGWFL